ncbi:hypothetical protein HP2RS_05051 [Helicobacter pylori]|nr:hypothetical protein HP2RS_05051 [Helicobacter pylori]OUC10155.1 hypothetical protein X568_07435 [Helicobacter pylori SS1]
MDCFLVCCKKDFLNCKNDFLNFLKRSVLPIVSPKNSRVFLKKAVVSIKR